MTERLDEETFNFAGITLAQEGGPYQPLVFEASPPATASVRRVASTLLNFWTSRADEWRTWRHAGQFELTFDIPQAGGGTAKTTTVLSFDALSDHLVENRCLNLSQMGLPSPNSNWMDHSVAISLPAHAPSNQGSHHMRLHLPSGLGAFAEAAPLLDREGVAFSNVVSTILSRTVRLRARLVADSRELFKLDGSWHEDLSSYLNACVSALDATVSRIYHRARNRTLEPTWQLDIREYPSARTIPRDKRLLIWLSQVAHRAFVDRHGDFAGFERLREVRHHLHHFDPPCFAMSIDDAADWLNLAHSVASFLLSIRAPLRLPPSLPLIELLLSPKVCAVPRAPNLRRVAQAADAGYASCRAERPIER